MTDELGSSGREPPENLFDLEDVRRPDAVAIGTAKRSPRRKATEQTGRNSTEGMATPRPPRRPTAGTGPVLLLSVEEAARSLSIGRSKAYELIAAGDLEAVHIGRSTRVPVCALHDLLDRLPRAAEG
jgi:excisionase family DNA binding protein